MEEIKVVFKDAIGAAASTAVEHTIFVEFGSRTEYYIGENGNWWINEIYTGVSARGEGGGESSDNSEVFTDFGLVGSVVTIDALKPNAIYLYHTPITALNITDSILDAFGIAHILFTAGDSITINYGGSGIVTMNSDVVAIGGKKHEISILGSDALLFVER